MNFFDSTFHKKELNKLLGLKISPPVKNSIKDEKAKLCCLIDKTLLYVDLDLNDDFDLINTA